MSKTLLVLRHAKAVTRLGLADHERPLAERGLKDSAAVGDFLRDNDLIPDQVLCSTAVRTRQTFERLALDVPVSYERSIYGNDVDDLKLLIQIAEADTLLLIGHNPSFHELVLDLTREPVDYFPTSALAVIELADWTAPGGRLITHRTPRTG